MQALHRKYELYVGRLRELDRRFRDGFVVGVTSGEILEDIEEKYGSLDVDIRTSPKSSDFILIKDHQMTATVVYDREGSGSKTPTQTLKIYNPEPKTEEHIKNGNIVILKAGYNIDSELPIIFAANIIRSEVTKNGADRVLKLTCGEAYECNRNVKYNKSFPIGTTYYDIIWDILKTFASFGVPTGHFYFGDISNKFIYKPMVFSTTIYDALETVCDAVRFKWYVARGLVNVEPKAYASDDEEFVKVITITESNVKNTIEALSNTSNKDKKDSQLNQKGIKLTVNLNGEIAGADGVKVSYGDYKGKYLITKVSHNLDFEGQQWDTTIECKA